MSVMTTINRTIENKSPLSAITVSNNYSTKTDLSFSSLFILTKRTTAFEYRSSLVFHRSSFRYICSLLLPICNPLAAFFPRPSPQRRVAHVSAFNKINTEEFNYRAGRGRMLLQAGGIKFRESFLCPPLNSGRRRRRHNPS